MQGTTGYTSAALDTAAIARARRNARQASSDVDGYDSDEDADADGEGEGGGVSLSSTVSLSRRGGGRAHVDDVLDNITDIRFVLAHALPCLVCLNCCFLPSCIVACRVHWLP